MTKIQIVSAKGRTDLNERIGRSSTNARLGKLATEEVCGYDLPDYVKRAIEDDFVSWSADQSGEGFRCA